ncbi:hypothetical protein BDZ94DRAFT_1264604 [Collybia nuda]|uniref:Uncharacterized protein n=1 Tax=Collybia nuda TaxID=64659 RepID=A0A9P5Y4E3_9AGAR|nr:hypothetical protein BDZ94DRAFT_1264604 [Collybia nuda]
MFTKYHLVIALAASSVSVIAVPTGNGQTQTPNKKGGWIEPAQTANNRAGKIKQTHQILAVEQHRNNEPHHPAVAPGNTAQVHDHFHSTNGGATHATVNYNNPSGQHVTTLHIAPDGTRLQGDAQQPPHHQGTSPPHNSPHGSPKHRREYLEARMFGGKGGWIEPSKGKGRDGKARQTHEVLAVDKHKQNEPGHHAVAPGNTAHVHDTFHSTQGGADHATVKYKDPNGNHVSTLHISSDGTRLHGTAQQPPHRSGTSPPPNSPAHRRRQLLEFVKRELQYLDGLD